MEHDIDCTLLGLTLASHGQLHDIIVSPCGIPEPEMLTISHSVRERVGIMCAGLLEIRGIADADNPTLESGGEDVISQLFYFNSHVNVEFVHRTAIDFLQDPRRGGAFLKASSPTDFDPQVSSVKASLARLSLSGTKCDKYVQEIMTQMWDAENRTGVAQEHLCEFKDDVMSNIDLTHPDWGPDSPWCTRRGSLVSDLYPNDPYPTSGVNHLPISTKHFHSSQNQLGTCLCRADLLGKKPAFMAFAAWDGLFHYVSHALTLQMLPIGTGVANWILCCSQNSMERSLRLSKKDTLAGVRLTSECLRRGADPNLILPSSVRLGNCTVWRNFWIQCFTTYIIVHTNSNAFLQELIFLELILLNFETITCRTTLDFIEHGPDLNTVFPHSLSLESNTPRNLRDGVFKYGTQGSRDYSFEVELSPLAIFELCLNDLNEIIQIKDICAAKGAESCRGCVTMTVVIIDGERKG